MFWNKDRQSEETRTPAQQEMAHRVASDLKAWPKSDGDVPPSMYEEYKSCYPMYQDREAVQWATAVREERRQQQYIQHQCQNEWLTDPLISEGRTPNTAGNPVVVNCLHPRDMGF